MNYANPFSLSSHGSFLNPKQNPSILTSFLSQNQSIRSYQSIPTKLSFTQHQKKTQKINCIRSKIITLHENRRSQNRNLQRVKYVSEHSTTPYLQISKKHPQFHSPILPKLSPEPKLGIQRNPYINIMTEPTATIEEHSDEQKSNIEDKQLILNKYNNILYATEISQNQEDQLSTTKLSLKSRFKQAVQKSFRSPPSKSLFNILISQEFTKYHEKEKQNIQIKFEPGNQVLASKLITLKKFILKKQVINSNKISTQSCYINIEQFNISTQTFQRKINQIYGSNSNNEVQQESFSLLPKSSRKSANFVSKLDNNIQQEFPQSNLCQNDNQKEHQSKAVQINITITFENIDQAVYQFNQPKHIHQNNILLNEEISQLQNISPKLTPKLLPMSLLPSNNHLQLLSSNKLDYNSSIINIKSKRLSRLSIHQGIIQDDVLSLEKKNEFHKPGLYFRVYYQNKLYKLMQKSNYTKENLEEIEENFTPKFIMSNTNTLINNAFTVMSTSEQGIRQRKTTNESLIDKIQFLGIKLPKYQIESEKLICDYNSESSQDLTESSDDSQLDVYSDKYLESPLLEPFQRNKKSSKRKKSNQENDQIYFYDDLTKNQKQFTTGIIKKIRDACHIPLFIQPILNILENSAKNKFLSYSISICEDFHMEYMKDKDYIANQKLLNYQQNSSLNSMIFQAIEMRYSQILIGRYLSTNRIIDFEYQDPEFQTIILEKQEKQEINDQQQSQQFQQSIFSQIKTQKKSIQKDSNNKKNQMGVKIKQNSQRYLQKQDSLQLNQFTQWNKKAMQSGDLSNTLQQSNQQNSNFFTQTSTALITKPTQTSQQSVFRVMSSKHIDLNRCQQDLSSSSDSLQNEETPQSGQVQKKTSTQQQHIQGSNSLQSGRNLHFMEEDSQQDLCQLYNSHRLQNNIDCLSMYMNSFRMRTQIKESSRRQKLDQIQQIKLSIYDHNYVEFIDNIQFIPETKLDTSFTNGNTFLILAAQCGCIEIVNELIKRGADINLQNDDGNTAVHLALAYGHYRIADLLMESGGSTHIINKKGQNAWGIL